MPTLMHKMKLEKCWWANSNILKPQRSPLSVPPAPF